MTTAAPGGSKCWQEVRLSTRWSRGPARKKTQFKGPLRLHAKFSLKTSQNKNKNKTLLCTKRIFKKYTMGKINFSKGPSPLQRGAHLQITHIRTSLATQTLLKTGQAKFVFCYKTLHQNESHSHYNFFFLTFNHQRLGNWNGHENYINVREICKPH